MQTAARYLRHTLIDWFSQDEVSRTQIGVIGAGAVGNEVLKCLSLLGVGAIDIYDFDKIELHNLTRSVLFRESDVGKNKAVCAAERLRDLDPNVRVTAQAGDFWRTMDLGAFGRYSAVICCVDNFEARIRLNLLSKLWGVNLINTGIDSRYVTVETYPFAQRPEGACYECSLPPSVYQRLSTRYSCGGLKKVAFVERRVPTTVITASLAGSLAASQALRFGTATRDARRIFVDSIAGSSSSADLPAREDCPVCAEIRAPVHMNQGRAAFAAALQRAGGDATIRFSEPLILSIECKRCGLAQGKDAPLLWRAADHDSRLVDCGACGAEGSVEVRIRDKISARALAGYESALPLRFAMLVSQDQTEVFVLEQEGADGGRQIHH
jgi:molybdopterin/thiamine biosynthesis adenylyltransferase